MPRGTYLFIDNIDCSASLHACVSAGATRGAGIEHARGAWFSAPHPSFTLLATPGKCHDILQDPCFKRFAAWKTTKIDRNPFGKPHKQRLFRYHRARGVRCRYPARAALVLNIRILTMATKAKAPAKKVTKPAAKALREEGYRRQARCEARSEEGRRRQEGRCRPQGHQGRPEQEPSSSPIWSSNRALKPSRSRPSWPAWKPRCWARWTRRAPAIHAARPVQGLRAEGSRQGQALRQGSVHRRSAGSRQAGFGEGEGSPAQEAEGRRAVISAQYPVKPGKARLARGGPFFARRAFA